MVDDITYDFLLQVCEGVYKARLRLGSIIDTVKNVMWKELCSLIWDFTSARAVVYVAMIYVL